MEFQRFDSLKAAIRSVNPDQVLDLEILIRTLVSEQLAAVALARRTQAVVENRTCPHCRGTDVVLHGKDKNGRQRFRCRVITCRKTFNILTGTPLARARKSEKWGQYLGYMTDHLSVRRIAEEGIGVNHVTIWRWRHRFLNAAAKANAGVLSGVIEADETFFVQSFKGHRGWTKDRPPAPRAARPSGWGALKRGLSHEQVAVLTALDNAGGVYETILPSRYAVADALDGKIAKSSVLCSDGQKGYVVAAVKAGAEHRRVTVQTVASDEMKATIRPTRKRQKGRLGLGRVNAHHGQIKTLINGRCRGVSTRYLSNYLGWHRAMVKGVAGKGLMEAALA